MECNRVVALDENLDFVLQNQAILAKQRVKAMLHLYTQHSETLSQRSKRCSISLFCYFCEL